MGLAGFGMGIEYQELPPRYAFPMRYALIFSAAAALHAQNDRDGHAHRYRPAGADRPGRHHAALAGGPRGYPASERGRRQRAVLRAVGSRLLQGAEAIRRTLDLRDAMQRVFDTHPELIALALTAADVERITRSGASPPS